MCVMAPNKVRANLYLNEEQWERFKAVTAKIPNSSASQMIDQLMAQAVPFLEQTVRLAESGDRDAFIALATMTMGQMSEEFGTTMAAVRKAPAKGEKITGG